MINSCNLTRLSYRNLIMFFLSKVKIDSSMFPVVFQCRLLFFVFLKTRSFHQFFRKTKNFRCNLFALFFERAIIDRVCKTHKNYPDNSHTDADNH